MARVATTTTTTQYVSTFTILLLQAGNPCNIYFIYSKQEQVGMPRKRFFQPFETVSLTASSLRMGSVITKRKVISMRILR